MRIPILGNEKQLRFSERNGHIEVLPQLGLGEISKQLCRQLDYYVQLEIERNRIPYNKAYLNETWERLTRDLWVLHFDRDISQHSRRTAEWTEFFSRQFANSDFVQIFDLIELLLGHSKSSELMKAEVRDAFSRLRTAYRIVDNLVVAIGTEEQAQAFVAALANTEKIGALGARTHLREAATYLRHGQWSESVRESIHAVEAMALRISLESGTLGKSLDKIQSNGHLHGGLKNAFKVLYGYSSDEEGVRHAMV